MAVPPETSIASDLKKVFAAALKSARDSRGLTQAELAAEAGLAVEVYGRLERGRVLPRAETLVRLAQALGVSTDSLLGQSGTAGRGHLGLVAEPKAEYRTSDPPEVRRLIRRIRTSRAETVRLLNLLVAALEKGEPAPVKRKPRK